MCLCVIRLFYRKHLPLIFVFRISHYDEVSKIIWYKIIYSAHISFTPKDKSSPSKQNMKNVHKLTSFEINIYSYQYHLFYHSSKSYWNKNTEVIGRFRAVHSISCIIWMHFSSMTMLLNHFLTVLGELRILV